jgi:hypothetical protein
VIIEVQMLLNLAIHGLLLRLHLFSRVLHVLTAALLISGRVLLALVLSALGVEYC